MSEAYRLKLKQRVYEALVGEKREPTNLEKALIRLVGVSYQVWKARSGLYRTDALAGALIDVEDALDELENQPKQSKLTEGNGNGL